MKKVIAFTKYNKRTKTFTGTNLFTGEVLFKNTKKIPFKREDTIIYFGDGYNIHPSLWLNSWFEVSDD